MSILKRVFSGVVAASLIAGALPVFASSAEARDYHRHGHRHSEGKPVRWGHPVHPRFHAAPPHHVYHPPVHHHRHKDRSGAAIAAGIGALILGGIIASTASRAHHGTYETYED
jgi:Ni/Co efflux regulator RcnB